MSAPAPPARWACRTCGAPITDDDARLPVAGLDTHECRNPAGVSYRVGTFAAAQGLDVASNPSREWSWFPGFQWQLEVCSRCHTHLGWLYTRLDQRFHGLILAELVAAPRPA